MVSPLSTSACSPACPIVIQRLQGEIAGADHLLAKAAAKLALLDQENSPLLRLPQYLQDLEEIEACAARFRRQSDRLVLVGIGGSSLGAAALTSIADSADPMQFHILDNPDPATMDKMLRDSDPHRTSWLFISKSGGTVETLSQILIILQWLEDRIGIEAIAERCVAVTEDKASPLKTLIEYYHLQAFKHENIGGRWACLSNIGLLPAACCGIDIRGCRQGAYAMLQHARATGIADNEPLQGALFVAAQHQASRRIHVVMPYTDQLNFTAWYGQLISESLGKSGKGITPLAARGAVDQHSMLQLMLDGPDDKFFTLITTDHAGKGKRIPRLADVCGLHYLTDQPIGNVLEAFQAGTIGSIKASGRPIRTMHLPESNAFNLGALLMYFMLETLYVSELLEVNPFDQPAVEDSKVRARFLLNNTK
jgi:glucose-6-phosphate isomerase